VQEIVASVNKVDGVKARMFIGQGGGREDKATGLKAKGMTQREQKQLVRDFFNGLFNVLVATCIAEEGLDIGEVDLIVNYDTHKSPIRMVQRMGRTARKRSGVVKTLLSSAEQDKLRASLKQVRKKGRSCWQREPFPARAQSPFRSSRTLVVSRPRRSRTL
jgi:ERCC4-related helicase